MSKTAKIKVVVIDDDEAIRLSLKSVLGTYDFDVLTFADPLLAVKSGATSSADCVLLDIRMPGMDGLAAQRLLAESRDTPPVIFMTGHGDVSTAVTAMKQGAFDFIEKPIDDVLLVELIRSAVRSLKPPDASPETREMMARYHTLTERERTVAQMVAEGYFTSAIASVLEISPRTVDHHRAKILAKMQATSYPQLVRILLQINRTG